MKKVISEQRLNNIISEAIQEAALRNTVRQMVIEEINRLMTEKKGKDGDEKHGKTTTNAYDSARNRIKSTLKGRKGEKYLYSTLAYRLWPNLNKDTARGKFSGKLDGREGRDFTDDEILKIDQTLRTR